MLLGRSMFEEVWGWKPPPPRWPDDYRVKHEVIRITAELSRKGTTCWESRNQEKIRSHLCLTTHPWISKLVMLAKQCLLTKTMLWESVTISKVVVVIEVIPPLKLLECTPSFLACKNCDEFLEICWKVEGCVKERQLSHLILFQIFKMTKKPPPPKLAVKNRSIPLCLNQSFGFLEPFNPRVPKTARQRIQSGFAALKITDGGKKCGRPHI